MKKETHVIVTYEQLLTVKESLRILAPMVPLDLYQIHTKPWSSDMDAYTGELIFVREEVAKKLARINAKLKGSSHVFANMELLIAYGYRHPAIQKKYFEEYLIQKRQEMPGKLPDEELYGIVHNFIAVPAVAGHPTGGAVDLTLCQNGIEIDMGTNIADFSDEEKLPTFSEKITSVQRANRLLLRNLMLEEEFAPFNGEWWHFSFGDKEWAFWHGCAPRYSQIDFTFKNLPE